MFFICYIILFANIIFNTLCIMNYLYKCFEWMKGNPKLFYCSEINFFYKIFWKELERLILYCNVLMLWLSLFLQKKMLFEYVISSIQSSLFENCVMIFLNHRFSTNNILAKLVALTKILLVLQLINTTGPLTIQFFRLLTFYFVQLDNKYKVQFSYHYYNLASVSFLPSNLLLFSF